MLFEVESKILKSPVQTEKGVIKVHDFLFQFCRSFTKTLKMSPPDSKFIFSVTSAISVLM